MGWSLWRGRQIPAAEARFVRRTPSKHGRKEGSIKPALVVFDLGGTTVYDRGEVPTAFTDTLREVGIVLDPQELTTLRGASKYEALRHLLGRQAEPMTARLDHIYACFQADLMARLARAQPLVIAGRAPGTRAAASRWYPSGGGEWLRSKHRRARAEVSRLE